MIFLLSLIGVLILSKKFIYPNLNTVDLINTYSKEVSFYANKYNVKTSLVLAIIEQESAGVPIALGTSGEIGLGQITKGALTDFNRVTKSNISQTDLFNPEVNINVTSFYISWLIHNFFDGNVQISLQAYNAGIGNVRKNSNVSIDYAKSVLKRQDNIITEIIKTI